MPGAGVLTPRSRGLARSMWSVAASSACLPRFGVMMHPSTRPDDTTEIVRRYASGEDRASEELYRRCKYPLLRFASQCIVRQHLLDVCIDAEVIVDKAFFNLRAARCHGDLAKTDDSQRFYQLLKSYVLLEIAHERARSQARKRRGKA